MTMSISIGLYPNLDLWNANKLHYINSLYFPYIHTSIYRLNTKDVEIVIVVVIISVKVTNVKCFNTIVVQCSHSN